MFKLVNLFFLFTIRIVEQQPNLLGSRVLDFLSDLVAMHLPRLCDSSKVLGARIVVLAAPEAGYSIV